MNDNNVTTFKIKCNQHEGGKIEYKVGNNFTNVAFAQKIAYGSGKSFLEHGNDLDSNLSSFLPSRAQTNVH